MKKALSTALILSLAFGFFSCEQQNGSKKSPSQHSKKNNERSHSKRNMVSQQSVEKSSMKEVQ